MKAKNNYFTEKDLIECPYCHNKYISLVRHIPYKHGISLEQFRKEFPEYKVQSGIKKEGTHRDCLDIHKSYYSKYLNNEDQYQCNICSKTFERLSGLQTHLVKCHGEKILTKKDILEGEDFKEEGFVCSICGKSFKNAIGLSIHEHMAHKDVYSISERDKKQAFNNLNKKGFECPICHSYYCNLSDHVRCTHNLSWEAFCNQYGWEGPKSYFTEEHKKNLSKNKKAFYQTSRGKELRSKQSFLSSTSLIEDSSGSFIKNDDIYNNRSYYFHWKSVDSKYKLFRSFEEFACSYFLEKYQIQYEYEPCYILYEMNGFTKRYTPDIRIGYTYYEIKSSLEDYASNEKYKFIEKTLERSQYKVQPLTFNICKDVFNRPDISLDEIYLNIKERFFSDKSFFIAGKFLDDYMKGKQSSLLKNIFKDSYTIFEEENIKRIRDYETSKYKSN